MAHSKYTITRRIKLQEHIGSRMKTLYFNITFNKNVENTIFLVRIECHNATNILI